MKISEIEVDFGQKNILYAELGFLNSLKYIHNFKSLRKKELMLKLELKNSLKHVANLISSLDKILPKDDLLKMEKKEKSSEKKTGAKSSLESEIAQIEAKLRQLR